MARREKWRIPQIWGRGNIIKGCLRSSLIIKDSQPRSSPLLSTLDIWSLYLEQKLNIWALDSYWRKNMVYLLYLQPRNIKFKWMNCLPLTPSSNFRRVFLHWTDAKYAPIFDFRETTRGEEVPAGKKGLHTALQAYAVNSPGSSPGPACQKELGTLFILECPESVSMLTLGSFPGKEMVRKKQNHLK